MKVLVYCPAFPVFRVHPLTVESILGMEWPKPFEVVFGMDDRDPNPSRAEGFANLLGKLETARRMAVAGDYDALMIVEADIVVPPNALVRLSQIKAGVVYGLYCSRKAKAGHRWLIMRGAKNQPALSDELEFRESAWGNVIDCDGYGTGCTLIRRSVFTKIPFRLPSTAVAPDLWFAKDCLRRGIVQKHDCGVVCGHVSEGRVIWPEPVEGYRVEEFYNSGVEFRNGV